MRTDTMIRNDGMSILIEKLGKVEAERFISLAIREPFDYTKWHGGLFEGMSVREISEVATKTLNAKQS